MASQSHPVMTIRHPVAIIRPEGTDLWRWQLIVMAIGSFMATGDFSNRPGESPPLRELLSLAAWGKPRFSVRITS
jgi:hypothetical protein